MPIWCTYRAYLPSGLALGPEQDPPPVFVLADVSAIVQGVSARLVVPTAGNRRFPYETYTPDRFRTLQYG